MSIEEMVQELWKSRNLLMALFALGLFLKGVKTFIDSYIASRSNQGPKEPKEPVEDTLGNKRTRRAKRKPSRTRERVWNENEQFREEVEELEAHTFDLKNEPEE